MVSLIRNGPKIFLISTPNPQKIKQFLIENQGASEGNLEGIFDKAEENNVVLILIGIGQEENLRITGQEEVLLFPYEVGTLMCSLINEKIYEDIEKIKKIRHLILMRGIGNLEKMVQEIARDFHGTVIPKSSLMKRYNSSGVLILVTELPIHLPRALDDFYENLVLVDSPVEPLYKGLWVHSVRYLNEGLENRDWYEMELNIYDRVSGYSLHHDRIMKVLEALELGIVIGESWTKESPRFLMKVDVYRIKLLTFYEPRYIKNMLMGLEYLENEMRIVDYDLYYKNKKMYWTDGLPKGQKNRKNLGMVYRAEIFSRLTEEDRAFLREKENEIASIQGD